MNRRTLMLGTAALATLATGPGKRAQAQDLPHPPLGDDGLHKPAWLTETFRDVRDDMDEAAASGKRLLYLVEQRGCIYCTRMHEEVYVDPRIDAMLRERFMVVQMNLFGNVPVTDIDGTELDERDMLRRWGVLFTPTMIFMRDTPLGADTESAVQHAAAIMPGAFERGTTRLMLQWVLEHGYEGDEHFQHYVARNL